MRKIVVFTLLLLVLITFSYLAFAYIDNIAYENKIREYDPLTPDVFGPLWVRNPLYIVAGGLIVLGWIAFGLYSPKHKKLAIIPLVMLFITSIASIPVVSADVVHVDVFVVADEEFNSGQISVPLYGWMDSNEYAEVFVFPNVYDYFMEEFSIEFHWHYWTSFYSYSSDYIEMLSEAKGQTGWFWGKVVDGEPMELMLVLTQQEMPSGDGWSAYWERVLLVHGETAMMHVLIHELGHQFMLLHCDADCVMNLTAYFTHTFGVDCGHYNKVMSNREILLQPPPDPPPEADPPPGSGGGYDGGKHVLVL